MNEIELPKKLAKQEVTDFTITWDNHLQPIFYPDGTPGVLQGIRTVDGTFRLNNGRTIHIHEDLD